ncbi:MAG: methionine synthase [Candidatus Electryonea clarkiae]|nr:methionine synthase [Candidatus Electryonea clarkiae]MDP8286681.1 methionine synthase [Candidatus Electryonea clarkiae]
MSISKDQDKITKQKLRELLSQRIIVTDGAIGTGLEVLQPTDEDFGGERFVGCNETLNLYAPHIVDQLHKSYIEAGADIIETNSFNGSPIVMEEYGIADQAREIAKKSAELANIAIERYAGDRKVFVAGSMGPGTKSISVTGGVTFDEIFECYKEYASGLLEGGSDLLVLETVQDTLNLKAAIFGIRAAQRELDRDAPLMVSVTVELGGTMLAGQNIEALYHSLSGFDLFSLGLNCATGPVLMTDHLRTLSSLSKFPVSIWPNAGLPDEDGKYSEGPEDFREVIGRFARNGFLNIAGGCCGTTPDHIRVIRETIDGLKPRSIPVKGNFPALSGNEAMVVEEDNRPVFVGERTNTIGSRKFKRLISEEKWDEAAEVGGSQVRKGAMVLDLCAADPDREEVDDFVNVLKPLLRKVRVPLFLDTTDPEVVKAALKSIGGKPAINSVNLEDGGERLREIAGLAKEYGASLICGLIDDDPDAGMAVTVERKLEVAGNIYRILKDEFNIPDQDIIFDPLVFPAGTGDPNYLGSAKHTIEGTRKIKEVFPDCLTVLGISNVSFGLPVAGREAINSVFLYLCTRAGLDMAIVNTQRLKRYPSLSEEEIKLAEDVLFNGDSSSLTSLTDHFRGVKVSSGEDEWAELSIEERVARAVIEARHTGLIDNLDSLLIDNNPLSIINGPLMKGMDEVGKLFGENKLIVAEVLESAEVMKAAVDHLQKFFPPGTEQQAKGKMVLATVKGDVHDIGKNLVDMIMSNNGFDIINLGIKVPPETIIDAVHEHNPDMIGLSGLLVRSAQQMVHTATDLSAAGIDLPLMVGGAALTRKFALTRIAPAYNGTVFYASEAMDGLSLGNKLVDEEKRGPLIDEWSKRSAELRDKDDAPKPAATKPMLDVSDFGWIETAVPEPPDLDQHILDTMPAEALFDMINPVMLYSKHLGVKKYNKRSKDPNDTKLLKLQNQVREVFEQGLKERIFEPKAIYRWFQASPETDKIVIEDPENREVFRFNFPRQKTGKGSCATDWVRPPEKGGDHLCLFVTTAGQNIIQRSSELRDEGKLLASHILQAIAIELAEASAEWLHVELRKLWGIPDDLTLSTKDLFNTKYHGIRLSFGYPACPFIEDQAGLFKLMKPEQIGVSLTEGYMMYPESSVSAIVFHHPKGQYYVA